MARPAGTVIVHDLAQAEAVLAAAAGSDATVRLASPPHAADWLGVAGFVAIVREASAAVPAGYAGAVLDCGDAPGHALGAFRMGLDASADEADPRARSALQSIAQAAGRRLLPRDPLSLDVGDEPGVADRLRLWLAARHAIPTPEQQESAR